MHRQVASSCARGVSDRSTPRTRGEILDLFGEDSWRNVYAGELEVRPPHGRAVGDEP